MRACLLRLRRTSKSTCIAGIFICMMMPDVAAACPDCAAGKQARAEVLDHDVGRNVVVTILPFLLIGALCMRLERQRRDAPSEKENK